MKCTGIAHTYKNTLISLCAVNCSGKLIDLTPDTSIVFSSKRTMIEYIIELSANQHITYDYYYLYERPIYNIIFFDTANMSYRPDKYPA